MGANEAPFELDEPLLPTAPTTHPADTAASTPATAPDLQPGGLVQQVDLTYQQQDTGSSQTDGSYTWTISYSQIGSTPPITPHTTAGELVTQAGFLPLSGPPCGA